MIRSTFLALRRFKDSPEPALIQCRDVLPPSSWEKASPRAFKSPTSPGLPVASVKTSGPEP